MLLEAGADVNARDYLDNTVLHHAAAHGLSAGVICCLLKAGADATAENTLCDTAAEVAQAYKHSATEALLSRAELDQHFTQQLQDAERMLPLHLTLNPDRQGWRCSTDMAHRTAVFNCLSELALFDSQQADRIELLQCVEFELYSTATDLAEYRDMKTVQQRAAAVYDTIESNYGDVAYVSIPEVEPKGYTLPEPSNVFWITSLLVGAGIICIDYGIEKIMKFKDTFMHQQQVIMENQETMLENQKALLEKMERVNNPIQNTMKNNK